jgi:hypothetical protein
MSSSSCLYVLLYKVQSLLSQIDIRPTESSIFDVLAFSETWLDLSIYNSDICISGIYSPKIIIIIIQTNINQQGLTVVRII